MANNMFVCKFFYISILFFTILSSNKALSYQNDNQSQNLSVFDVEQMLIHIQNYPSYEMMQLFNEPILTNRKKMERGINFDREAILHGRLLE